MYDTWKIERWETPFSDATSLVMARLVDCDGLSIVLEAPHLTDRPRWRIEFGRCAAYRNILEEYRLGLWAHLDQSKQRCGNAFVVTNSPWIAEFREHEPLLEVHDSGVKHFVVATEDDVVEILSGSPPRIVGLGSTDPDEPPAGKSLVFSMPGDSEAAAKVLGQLARELRPRRWWERLRRQR